MAARMTVLARMVVFSAVVVCRFGPKFFVYGFGGKFPTFSITFFRALSFGFFRFFWFWGTRYAGYRLYWKFWALTFFLGLGETFRQKCFPLFLRALSNGTVFGEKMLAALCGWTNFWRRSGAPGGGSWQFLLNFGAFSGQFSGFLGWIPWEFSRSDKSFSHFFCEPFRMAPFLEKKC